MAGIRVESKVYYRDHLGRFASAIEAGTVAAMDEISREGATLAGEFAPKRTGRLAGGIHPIGGGAQGGWATPELRYAMPQEEGAGPHAIGDPGQMLGTKEGDFSARGPVWHPGNPAVRYMKRSYDFMKSRMLPIVARHMP